MFMPTLCLVLPAADRAQLTDVVVNGNTPQKLVVRARIMLMLADRVRPSHIARQLAISRNHVHYWLRRYVALSVSGVLHDAPIAGNVGIDLNCISGGHRSLQRGNGTSCREGPPRPAISVGHTAAFRARTCQNTFVNSPATEIVALAAVVETQLPLQIPSSDRS